MNKKRSLLSYFFIIILCVFFVGYFYEYLNYKQDQRQDNILKNELLNEGYLFDDTKVTINYQELYPFEDTTTTNSNKQSLLSKINTKLTSIISKVDKLADDLILGKDSIIYTYGKITDFIGNRIVYQDAIVYKLDNDYEINITEAIDVTANAENLTNFGKFIEDKDIPFLYIQAPYKLPYDEYTDVDYSNTNANALLTLLTDIPTFDLRKQFEVDGYNNYELFFKTDHHWKPETGLLAAKYIAEKLCMDYQLDIDTDVFYPSLYKTTVYENYFLGSQGKKFGLGMNDAEDISIITPTFETNLTYICDTKNINITDTYDKVMFDYGQLYKKDVYNVSTYEAYAHGNTALTTIKNNLAANNTKILLIRDSFSSVVVPFLSLSVKELDTIDLRYFNGSLETYINDNDYDAVIVLYNPSAIVEVEGRNTSSFFYFK